MPHVVHSISTTIICPISITCTASAAGVRIRDLTKQGSGPSTPRGFAQEQRKAAGVEDSESETEAPQVTLHAALPAGGMSGLGSLSWHAALPAGAEQKPTMPCALAHCSDSWGGAAADLASRGVSLCSKRSASGVQACSICQNALLHPFTSWTSQASS